MCTRSHTDFLNCSSITFPTLGFLWRNITNFFKFCSHSHNRVDVIAQTQTTVIYTPVAEWKQIKTTQHPISRALLWLIYPSWENEECIVDLVHCAQYWSCNSSQNGHNYYCWKGLSREWRATVLPLPPLNKGVTQQHRSKLIKELSFTVLLCMSPVWLG